MTTLTSMRQFITEIDNSVNGILDAEKHLRKHLNDNGLITEDVEYFLDTIIKYASRVRTGFES